jgi:membrane-associated phospholipid phosphatase
LIGTACLVIITVLLVMFVDRPLTRFLAGTNPAIRSAGHLLGVGFGVPFALGLTLVLLVLYVFRVHIRRRPLAREWPLLFVPVSTLSALVLVHALKIVFGRYRPELFLSSGTYGFDFGRVGAGYDSFPSAHATTGFALLVAVTLVRPRLRLPLMVLATLLAAARVVANAHFLSDVVAGSLLGISIAVLVHAAFSTRR